MFSKCLARVNYTQLLELAVSSCANTEASATATAANASTSVEDDSDFFNFIIKHFPTFQLFPIVAIKQTQCNF